MFKKFLVTFFVIAVIIIARPSKMNAMYIPDVFEDILQDDHGQDAYTFFKKHPELFANLTALVVIASDLNQSCDNVATIIKNGLIPAVFSELFYQDLDSDGLLYSLSRYGHRAFMLCFMHWFVMCSVQDNFADILVQNS